MRARGAVRIGTRGSALALVQANLVAAALEASGTASELVVVETAGDRRAPDTAWGEGAFVAAIERALLDERVDVAVHSAKDVPTDEDPHLEIAAFLPRADPGDALVVAAGSPATGLADLPAGSVIGTDSPRRTAFLRGLRPDLAFRPLHGNVDTRLRRLDAGEADALVLAVAGLARLGRDDRITERLPVDAVPPAPGQGAIAVQVRAGDTRTRRAVAALDDRPTRIAVETERAFLRAAGGGCRAPIGALATLDGDDLRVIGGFAGEDGTTAVERTSGTGLDGARLAASLASRLVTRLGSRADRPRLLVTRPEDDAHRLATLLDQRGIGAAIVPAIEIVPAPPAPELDAAVRAIGTARWTVVTSPNGAAAALAAAARLGVDPSSARWAAVGAGTAAVLHAAGVRDVWQPAVARAAAVADALPIRADDAVVLLRGSLADASLPDGLRRRGAAVRSAVAYRTVEAPPPSGPALASALAGRIDGVILASGSAVRGLVALAGPDLRDAVLDLPAICVGPATARAAEAAGFRVLGIAGRAAAEDLADLAVRLLRPPLGVLP